MRQYPRWMIKPFSPDGTSREVDQLLDGLKLNTVCESARCPNLHECWSQRQLTFMILGDTCTRSCRFCAVTSGRPQSVDPDEPRRVAEAIRRLRLRHVVITSVARDDLADEGAEHFVNVLRAIRMVNADVTTEILVPDFHGRRELIERVLHEGRPEVFSHNVETVARLSALVRPQAEYARSLAVLSTAASLTHGTLIKSGLMVGLGESLEELDATFLDLVRAGVTHLTIGQYLRPSASHLPEMEFVSPTRFETMRARAMHAGLQWVIAGPFVRSSYHAIDAVQPGREPLMAG